ncbi:TetR/AcrR family transcriptional regulator [Shewanella xiamenensis]|uniref:TetR/AcrR family transcriptional regulator n=1 Tax=Shewanella xiamenensis TaxID=332186 RepID=UPI0024A635E1|nr:TetR/AcrR family transcriptional regulator [Shewanella xiamenensis]MDI5835252.1 TetR/AcrR family transcriptional regulator [Shewanella xiamenensis]MDI5839051.1 TetR/AcrR family transcriptional regulator [Shewanella xiamenensis]MDI5843054.1 TetR/AcrR family transcriptional regulator [Shewanella xiamenensis]MDI5847015.1 TetR/AcrR family transcriptional regulator [Shewanella xiamenensis]MDI5851291.1 TetR/AcrR family transcriptional regulator [Shewanella xiamenensis]
MDNKRDLILRSAEKIIATAGLHNLSMQKLAVDAGVAAGTIYRYFKDKEDLIIELRKDVLQQIASKLLENINEGSFDEKFRRLWFKIVELGREQSHANLSFAQYSHLPGVDAPEHQAFEREIFQPLHQLFEQAKNQEMIQKLDNTLLFSIAFEPAIAIGKRLRRGHLECTENEIRRACELCLKAISINLQL